MTTRKPIFVQVHWSENEEFPEAEDGRVYDFAAFEAKATRVARAKTTGGYDKTNVTVMFDDGDRYQLRLDLNSKETCFQHAVFNRLHPDALARVADLPAESEYAKSWSRLLDFLRSITFQHAWIG